MYDVYRAKNTVYWRDKLKYYCCDTNTQENYCVINRDNVSEPPPLSHPVSYQLLTGAQLWAWKTYLPRNIPLKSDNRTLLQDDFSEHSGDKLTLVSNASVHILNDTASRAWQLCADQNKKQRVSQPLEQQAHSHSYCHESDIFNLALQDVGKQLRTPHHIMKHTDCEAAIKALAQPTYKPGHNMVTDTDLIMARGRLKSIIPHTVTDECVMGHASGKKKKSPKTITSLKRDNSECDLDVEHCIQLGGPPSTFIHYPGF